MSSFGALIAKLQYVKHVVFFLGTPGRAEFLLTMKKHIQFYLLVSLQR